MVVAYTNGHNKHPIPPEQLDLNLNEPVLEEPKPCALRLGYGSWCFLPDGHRGDHEGVPPIYGPIEERPVLWRRHKGQQR